ncbi:hypothetical protein CEXT_408551 [Caerostris extrusa]|uniref:Uncharacterized protein n=1 Tax=Caerostris extrusa TaxID=172846 RepID=A0AAV4SYP7_CAEEX|nr:hypothetical protein CEXT_408551 [Caerostris extrusa]
MSINLIQSYISETATEIEPITGFESQVVVAHLHNPKRGIESQVVVTHVHILDISVNSNCNRARKWIRIVGFEEFGLFEQVDSVRKIK